MADRIELLVTEDREDSPWLCGIEDCPKVESQPFCLGPCLVTQAATLNQEVQRDTIAADKFAGQPGLMSFDVYLVGPTDIENRINIRSNVDFGRQAMTHESLVMRANRSQHVHHDLVVPTGYNTHGNRVTLLVQVQDGPVNVPYNLYIDNLSLTLFYPPGETGPAPSGTTLGGHDYDEFTASIASAAASSTSSVPSIVETAPVGPASSGSEQVNLGAIIGGSLAGIFVIGVVWILLVGYMNRRKMKYQHQQQQQQQQNMPFSGMLYPEAKFSSPPATMQGHGGHSNFSSTEPSTAPTSPRQVPSWMPTAFPLPAPSPQPQQQPQQQLYAGTPAAVPLLTNPHFHAYPEYRETGLPSYEANPSSPSQHPTSLIHPMSPVSEQPTEDMGTAISSSVDHGRPRTAPDRKYTIGNGGGNGGPITQ